MDLMGTPLTVFWSKSIGALESQAQPEVHFQNLVFYEKFNTKKNQIKTFPLIYRPYVKCCDFYTLTKWRTLNNIHAKELLF